MDTEKTARRIFMDRLKVSADEAKDSALIIEDLGADSLDIVGLIMAFEKEFIIEIVADDLEEIATIGDAIRYVQRRIAESA